MTGPPPKRRICLIGFMGAGKTTVGKVLARHLKRQFFDLDELIERQEQRSIAAIFELSGERVFRAMESAALTKLLERSEDDYIVALGGGAFVQPQNRRMLEQAGAVTILLSAPLEELERRCKTQGTPRPLARNQAAFEHLFAARQEAYALAQFRVETLGREISDIVHEIERIIKVSN